MIENRFKQTERILYDYKTYKVYVKNVDKNIEDIKKQVNGALQAVVTDSIRVCCSNTINKSSEKKAIKAADAILKLEISTYKERNRIKIIEDTLEVIPQTLKDIFKYRYCQECSVDEVASLLNVSRKTYFNKRKELVNAMKIALFGGEEE